MAIEDEPLDPRPVDRHRMDLHNCHSPSTGPPSFTGTTTTMVAARMRVSRGNTGGEHPLRARCSPWIGPHRGFVLVNVTRLARGERSRQLPVVVQVTAVVVGRRSVPPAWWRHCRSGRQQQSRGVSDHPKWPLGLPSLRPATWSLTPPLKECWRPVPARVSPLEAAVNSTRNLRENLMDFSTLFSHWSRLSDWNG